jgi:serine/threonine protein phosphatase PrpC
MMTAGSATATICVLNNKEMTALNLGDSGFILVRFDTLTNSPFVLMKSKEQTHKFNTPYQLTVLPNEDFFNKLGKDNKLKEIEILQKALKERTFF